MTFSLLQDFHVRATQKLILEAFPELSHRERKLFLPEYKARLQSASIPDADGLFHAHCHGFLIFGEKMKESNSEIPTAALEKRFD